MYKRYIISEKNESKIPNLAGIFNFFVFCTIVTWAVPFAIEMMSGHSVEMYMMPPTWRAEILCSPSGAGADHQYTYLYDGECSRLCKVPGCGGEGPSTKSPDWEANLAKAREGIDLYDMFEVVLNVLRYGTLSAALISLGVMRVRGMFAGRPAWVWACVPCVAMSAVAAMRPEMVWAALMVWAAAYAADMWSTSRFGVENVRLNEANPVLRRLMRYGMRRGMALHTILYAGLVVCVPQVLGPVGMLEWDAMMGMLAFGLAAGHVWVAAANIAYYKMMEVGR